MSALKEQGEGHTQRVPLGEFFLEKKRGAEMKETTPNHTQTVDGWAARDSSGKITPFVFKRRYRLVYFCNIGSFLDQFRRPVTLV